MISLHLWRSHQQPEIVKTWKFYHQDLIRIGRANDNDVVLSHVNVSRYHAELRRTDKGWNLTNLGVNSTLWRGQPVHYVALPKEAVIQLAATGPNLLVRDLPECKHEGNAQNNLFCCHCGAPLQVQKSIRDYQVVRLLGQGGMGTTYQVWHRGRIKVLKEMNADMANNAKAQELFEREASMLKRLKNKGIPKFYEYFVSANSKYLVMEMIYGQDLEKWVMQHGVVAIKQAIAWMLQLCDILRYLHSQDPPIVHRDIKPANLIIRNHDKSLVLLDFGAVKEVGALSGTRIGAPSYSAPEQNIGKPVIQSDLYAIAPTLIFLLTGRNPANFLEDRGSGSHFYSDRIPHISSQLVNIITKLSHSQPHLRYQTAIELAEALKQV